MVFQWTFTIWTLRSVREWERRKLSGTNCFLEFVSVVCWSSDSLLLPHSCSWTIFCSGKLKQIKRFAFICIGIYWKHKVSKDYTQQLHCMLCYLLPCLSELPLLLSMKQSLHIAKVQRTEYLFGFCHMGIHVIMSLYNCIVSWEGQWFLYCVGVFVMEGL